MRMMGSKEVCYETLDYESRFCKSKPPLFHELNFFKKVNKAMKMFNKIVLRIKVYKFKWNKYTSNSI